VLTSAHHARFAPRDSLVGTPAWLSGSVA